MTLFDTPEVFSREMKRAAIEREIRLRERVYPRRVAEKKMSKEKAAYEIACMAAIAEDYKP